MSTGTTKLWATASKEWIIPSKPKPGRKPKKDLPAAENQDDDEAKGRRVQNRAAQRAFRERKQSQLSELQARITAYEQGEIERNVALQKIAKRLKEDNERLVKENMVLREKVAKLEEQLQDTSGDPSEKKRWRDESPSHNRSVRKRTRTSATPPTIPQDASSDQPSPATTLVATPDAISPPTYTVPTDIEQSGLNEMLFSSTMKDVSIDSFPQFNCGFCSDDTPCVCRELALNQLNDSATQELLAGFKVSPFTPGEASSMGAQARSKPTAASSILENLPAYQPPVPLRRKFSKASSKPTVFPVSSAPEPRASSSSDASCSGDPSNCAACNDDAFGKAFCSAIEETVNTRAICDNCPSRHPDGGLDPCRPGLSTRSGCCGSLVGCTTCPSSSSSSAQARTVIQYESDMSQNYTSQEYIPTNDAWRQIKAHPNVQFADLSLLAEVVSSRSKCTGPRIVLTPPPELHHQHMAQSEANGFGSPNTQFTIKQEGPRLVPQEVLLECGRRRVREVHSEAVRDALRLLDAKFT